MKDFNEFINEKLTLNDISKMSNRNRWVDVKKFKGIEDLKEGNLVKLKSDRIFVVVPTDLAEQLPGEFITDYDYLLIRLEKYPSGSLMYPYMKFESYKRNFPYSISYKVGFKIEEINTRIKKYKNLHDLEEDLKNIDKF